MAIVTISNKSQAKVQRTPRSWNVKYSPMYFSERRGLAFLQIWQLAGDEKDLTK